MQWITLLIVVLWTVLFFWPRRKPKPICKPLPYVTPQSLVSARNVAHRYYLIVEGEQHNPTWLVEGPSQGVSAATAARDDYRAAGRKCSDVMASYTVLQDTRPRRAR